VSDQEHTLKCWPEYFAKVVAGRKRFEIRRNDRNYTEGDRIVLREWDSTDGYSGRTAEFVIGYVTAFEQQDGFVVFSLREWQR
jgi:hypothetical protein